MKHAFTAIIVFFIGVTLCFAQASDKPRLSALSLELGKTGLIYNLSFDQKLATKNYGFRFGAGSNFGKYSIAITVGGGGYYLVGGQNRFLELGADMQYLIVAKVADAPKHFSLVYPDYSIKTFYPSLNLGYRRYGRRTLFRVGFSPGLIEEKFVPGGYISYGLTF
jgi:hypothetical protein